MAICQFIGLAPPCTDSTNSITYCIQVLIVLHLHTCLCWLSQQCLSDGVCGQHWCILRVLLIVVLFITSDPGRQIVFILFTQVAVNFFILCWNIYCFEIQWWWILCLSKQEKIDQQLWCNEALAHHISNRFIAQSLIQNIAHCHLVVKQMHRK